MDTGLNPPEKSTASHSGLYKEHIRRCNMVDRPLAQVAVKCDSVHPRRLGDKLERVERARRMESKEEAQDPKSKEER